MQRPQKGDRNTAGRCVAAATGELPVPNPVTGRRRCLFTSAGDRNIVSEWVSAARPRSFDLVIAYYGDDDGEFQRLSALSDLCIRIKGGKYQNAWNLWRSGQLRIADYDFVWLADDDMRIAPADIERCFALAETFGFWVSSPAHDPAGKISNPFMVRDGGGQDIRIVTYIEVTWPLFRADKLEAFFQVFDGTLTCWGVDHWFANVFKSERHQRFAIFDCIPAINLPDSAKGGQREIGRLITDQQLVDAYMAARARHGFAGARPRTLSRINLEWDLRLRLFGPSHQGLGRLSDIRPPALPPTQDEGSPAAAGSIRERAGFTPEEVEFLERNVSEAEDLSLFGALWTLPAAARGRARHILAVDGDRFQCETTLLDPEARAAHQAGRLTMLHVDIGPLRALGFPASAASMSHWRAYPEAPWGTWARMDRFPDLVVVAGRFRKACCLRTFVEWIVQAGRPPTRVILRNQVAGTADFASELSGFMGVVETVGSLVCLAPKPYLPGFDGSHASFMLQRWQLDPR